MCVVHVCASQGSRPHRDVCDGLLAAALAHDGGADAEAAGLAPDALSQVDEAVLRGAHLGQAAAGPGNAQMGRHITGDQVSTFKFTAGCWH
jgi:hypothetical protein